MLSMMDHAYLFDVQKYEILRINEITSRHKIVLKDRKQSYGQNRLLMIYDDKWF